MPDLSPTIPLSEQIAEVEREIKEREREYPGHVVKGRMRREQAHRHIDAMRAVLATLRTTLTGGQNRE